MTPIPTPFSHPRGLLLLDVDGPLNPDEKNCRRPPGYHSYRLTKTGGWHTGRDFRRFKGLKVWLNPDHGPQIRALAEETGLQPVWATSWMNEANTYIGPSIGLPHLPVLTFPTDDLDWEDRRWRPAGRWKWAAVGSWADGIPLAWWDDDFHDKDFAEARAEFMRRRSGVPTLLCHVESRFGLRNEHFNQVREWALTLKPDSGPAQHSVTGRSPAPNVTSLD